MSQELSRGTSFTKKLGRRVLRAKRDRDGFLFYQIHVRLSGLHLELLNEEITRLEKNHPGIKFSRSDAVRSLLNRKRA